MGRSLRTAFALSAGVLALVVVEAQPRSKTAPGKVITLTPLDYIEIRQLAARYGHAVDQGADNGYAYADLFAPDGTFAAVIDIIPGQQAVSHPIYLVGRYDDEYVKTPQGWRFRTRVLTTAARREPTAATR